MTSSDHMAFPDSAEGWVARLDAPGAGPAEAAAFDAWCAREAGRRSAYREARRLHDAVRRLGDDDLVRAASRQALARTARRRRTRRLVVGAAAVAASLLVTVPFAWWYLQAPTVAAYATADRIDTFLLPDGTRMLMDAQSRASIRFDRRTRRVVLVGGRAQFQVGKGEAPFEVRSGGVVIHDIGTTFQVDHRTADTHIGLIEGQVWVSNGHDAVPTTLARGEAVRIGADGGMGPVHPLEPARAEGWTRGQLVFQGERLADLLATMNRYARTKVGLADEALGDLRISGNFHAGDQDALVAALVAGWNLTPERRADGTLLLHSGGAPSPKGSLR